MRSVHKIDQEELTEILATWLRNHHGLKVPDNATLTWLNSSNDEEVGDCNLIPAISFGDDD